MAAASQNSEIQDVLCLCIVQIAIPLKFLEIEVGKDEMRISCRPFPTTKRITMAVKYKAQVVVHHFWSKATFYRSQNILGFTNEKLMYGKCNQQHLSSWVLLLSSTFSSPDGDWMKSSSHLGMLFVFLPTEVTLNSTNNYLIIASLLLILLWGYSPL